MLAVLLGVSGWIEIQAAAQMKLVVSAGYLPQVPVLVRVEVLESDGRRDWEVSDAQATLSANNPGVSLSTNRVQLRNGMGSALVTFTGGGDFDLSVVLIGPPATRRMEDWSGLPVTLIGGTLPGASSTWSGVMLVTNDVTVPAAHTLTILSNTLVLINGVASGTSGNDLLVNGTLLSLGTEERPVTITCANLAANMRWGQIRHTSAQPSTYRHTIITRAGRAPGEGHTGQAPAIRSSNSRILFDGCSITDLAEMNQSAADFGRPGKVMQSSGSDLIMTNCLLSRARMGPEIGSTSLLFLNSHIIDMRGPDDADGIYLHSQQAGQVIRLSGSVVAGGDDDGIDTLGADITVEDCLVRGWKYPGDDSKGISVLGGEVRVWRSLLFDNTIGLSGKGGNGENVRVRMDGCTVIGNSYGVAVTNKTGSTPVIDYRITNCIIRAPDPVFTDYNPDDIHIDYSDVGEVWPGVGNTTDDPLFVSPGKSNFRLEPYSPCIDSGDPATAPDPDGSRADMGVYRFAPPRPVLSAPQGLANGSFGFVLNAYTNRNYVIDFSTNASSWNQLTTVFQTNGASAVADADATLSPHRIYRARLAP